MADTQKYNWRMSFLAVSAICLSLFSPAPPASAGGPADPNLPARAYTTTSLGWSAAVVQADAPSCSSKPASPNIGDTCGDPPVYDDGHCGWLGQWPCKDGERYGVSLATGYYDLTVTYALSDCPIPGSSGYCRAPRGLAIVGVETMPGQRVISISGLRDGVSFSCPADSCSFAIDNTPGTVFSDLRAFSSLGDSSYPLSIPPVRVDTLPPETTAQLTGVMGQASFFVSESVQLTFSAVDVTSGATRVEASVDGGAWVEASGGLSLAGQGLHTVQYRAYDAAGWQEEMREIQLMIDSVAPKASAWITCPLWGQNDYCLAPLQVQASLNEAGSLTYTYRGQTHSAGPTLAFAEGRVDNGLLLVYGIDLAGNRSSDTGVAVPAVDGAPPVIKLEGGDRHSLKVDVSDSESGVAGWTLQVFNEDGQSVFWKEFTGPYRGLVAWEGGSLPEGRYEVEIFAHDNAGIEAHLPRVRLGMTADGTGVLSGAPVGSLVLTDSHASSDPQAASPIFTSPSPDGIVMGSAAGGSSASGRSSPIVNPPPTVSWLTAVNPTVTLTIPPSARANPPLPMGWLLPLVALLAGTGTGIIAGKGQHERAQLALALLTALVTIAAGAGWQISRTAPSALNVPSRLQDTGSVDCGPVALGMAFDFFSLTHSGPSRPAPDTRSLVDWMTRRGAMHKFGTGVEELAYTAREHGYEGSFYFCDWTIDRLKEQLRAGRPVVVSLKLDDYQQESGHFVTVTGVSPDGTSLFVNDPMAGAMTLSLKAFTAAWQANGGCGVLVTPKPVPAIPESSAPLFGGVGAAAALAALAAIGTARSGLGAGKAGQNPAAAEKGIENWKSKAQPVSPAPMSFRLEAEEAPFIKKAQNVPRAGPSPSSTPRPGQRPDQGVPQSEWRETVAAPVSPAPSGLESAQEIRVWQQHKDAEDKARRLATEALEQSQQAGKDGRAVDRARSAQTPAATATQPLPPGCTTPPPATASAPRSWGEAIWGWLFPSATPVSVSSPTAGATPTITPTPSSTISWQERLATADKQIDSGQTLIAQVPTFMPTIQHYVTVTKKLTQKAGRPANGPITPALNYMSAGSPVGAELAARIDRYQLEVVYSATGGSGVAPFQNWIILPDTLQSPAAQQTPGGAALVAHELTHVLQRLFGRNPNLNPVDLLQGTPVWEGTPNPFWPSGLEGPSSLAPILPLGKSTNYMEVQAMAVGKAVEYDLLTAGASPAGGPGAPTPATDPYRQGLLDDIATYLDADIENAMRYLVQQHPNGELYRNNYVIEHAPGGSLSAANAWQTEFPSLGLSNSVPHLQALASQGRVQSAGPLDPATGYTPTATATSTLTNTPTASQTLPTAPALSASAPTPATTSATAQTPSATPAAPTQTSSPSITATPPASTETPTPSPTPDCP